MAGITFRSLSTSGAGEFRRGLGPKVGLPHMVNAVELLFDVDGAIRSRYSAFVARQWLGPEAHWIKRGSPLFSPWIKVTPPPTSNFDDSPDPGNVLDRGSDIVYYDNPGPNPFLALYAGATRIQVVQNFTGWIDGKAIATGASENLVGAPAAWFSIVDIA